MHASDELMKKMASLIKHRGPDDSGTFLDNRVGLFSNRLSIIDLEGGHQPIFNEDGSLVIVFNGEIYNFPEIRHDLEKKGHRFKTATDTEVILHGFEQYGTQIFSMLNGMFAVALWDSKKRRLILARDRVGIKPLYFSRTSSGDIVFCSEIKGILAHPEVSPAVNTEALYFLVALYYVPFERKLFSGVQKIPPGHFYDSINDTITAYWRPSPLKDNLVPEIPTVRNALENSVKRQLISDVDVGSFLSGGLDTSTIVAFAAKHYPNRLKTFCMGFGHQDDELEDAKRVAEHFGTEHHEFTITDKATLELYPKMIWHSELPKVNTYSWFVNEYARKYVKVCLSGLGGDELFFGYPTSSRYVSFQKAQSAMKVPGVSFLSVFASGKRKTVLASLKDRASTYLSTVSPIFGNTEEFVFAKDTAKHKKSLHDEMKTRFFSDENEFVQQAVNAEFQTKLPDDFLSIDDSMSMAHSLENRVPLLDNELIDLIQPVPYRYNYVGGVGKALLRESMKGILPENCFRKPKQGFSLNLVEWWSGELGEEIRKTIPESQSVRQYFNSEYLKKISNEAGSSYTTVSLLWHVYAFHIWHEIFVEGKSV